MAPRLEVGLAMSEAEFGGRVGKRLVLVLRKGADLEISPGPGVAETHMERLGQSHSYANAKETLDNRKVALHAVGLKASKAVKNFIGLGAKHTISRDYERMKGFAAGVTYRLIFVGLGGGG